MSAMAKILNQTNTTLKLNTYDYSHNSTFFFYFLEYVLYEWYFPRLMSYMTDTINVLLLPLVALTGLVINIICVFVFSNPCLKSVIYKYLLANCSFDLVTIVLFLLRSMVNFVRKTSFRSHASALEICFLVYITSVSITCSNLCKLVILLERICKLRKSLRRLTTNAAFKYIIALMVIFSLVANSPLIFGYKMYADVGLKQSYFFMTLNQYGHKSSTGIFMVLNAILVEAGIYLLVVLTSIFLLIEIRLHLKKLGKLARTSTIAEQNINFEVDNDDNLDEAYDVFYINHAEPVSTISAPPSYRELEMAHAPGAEPVQQAEAAEGQQVRIASAEQVSEEMLKLMEKTRCQLSKMVSMNCLSYILGHTLFIAVAVFVQIRYFFYMGPYLNIFVKSHDLINLLVACAYLLLYTSYCANFFIFYKFDRMFRHILANKQPEEQQDAPSPD
nr:G protein-coupled receptor [Proales similis]